MVKKAVRVVEEAKKERSPLLEGARKVLLAGVGAVALAQDEAEDFVKKLVERGEIAEQDGKKLMHELLEKRKKQAKGLESSLDKRVEEILSRMNVPTKSDVQALSERVAALTKKVEAMKK
ncbi:MAG: phasin family protein [Thermoflexales bacterium]|nr:phasin family protein [Thermoflexales bacterium]